VSIRNHPHKNLLTHRGQKSSCVSISFYGGVSLLTHGLNRPISALCVSIHFYEGVSLLTHRLAPGLFCTPATEAILKQLP
jgi:hypothetical protein